ncbi:RNA recognition motif domain-containing protein [Ditylenchus destructor]|nr:RNA recognition motif domain-containing protein [Ditylenchus destructor]
MESVQTEVKAVSQRKQRRKRPRTKAIRFRLKSKLETAILSNENDILAMFTPNADEILRAPLSDIYKKLGLDQCPEYTSLTATAIISISNVTRVFKIVETENKLWILVNKRACEGSEEKTVYVDNLPRKCTEARLRRRAVVFGTVVSVVLPKITRIQRTIGSTHNSGFGFVQFASKTAAKRFCKRYAANSRLKRLKHSHGHRKRQTAKDKNIRKSGNDSIQQMQEDDQNMPESADLLEAHSTITSEEAMEISSVVNDSTSDIMHVGGKQNETVEEKVTILQESTNLVTKVCPRRMLTSLSVDESGNETENELSKSATKMGAKKKTKIRRRRRCRHKARGTTQDDTPHPVGSLTKLLKKIQVFPLKHYKELRAEYLKMRKERMSAVKLQIKDYSSQAKMNEDKVNNRQKLDQAPAGRKRKRGRQRLESKIQKIREQCFANSQ